ncbi:hypothetical protein SS50377_25482 [Spironucleus salmonicida]|uniref:Uncharacterized protein n=1 Tax=Spironucleus salmonicida TaxID=348837 RepID=V6LK80_9EUKA|nr:hypothetical protein SS50377_25482 [Spironucleus salmonicida]|eukprot:EST45030.1 Hypothetical protein SS50377_15049 [Spironucleus salmonicida]
MADIYSDDALEFIQSQVVDLQSKNTDLFTQSLKKDKTIIDLQNTISVLKTDQKQQKILIETYKKQFISLGICNFDKDGLIDLQKYQDENIDINQRLLDLQIKYDNLVIEHRNTLETITRTTDTLSNKELQYQDEVFMLTNQVCDLEQNLSEIKIELQLANTLIDSQMDQIQTIKTKKQTLKTEMNQITISFNNNKLALSSLIDTLSEVQFNIDDIRNSVINIKFYLQTQLSQFDQYFSSQFQELATLSGKFVINFFNKGQQIKLEKDNLIMKNEALQEYIEELKTSNSDLNRLKNCEKQANQQIENLKIEIIAQDQVFKLEQQEFERIISKQITELKDLRDTEVLQQQLYQKLTAENLILQQEQEKSERIAIAKTQENQVLNQKFTNQISALKGLFNTQSITLNEKNRQLDQQIKLSKITISNQRNQIQAAANYNLNQKSRNYEFQGTQTENNEERDVINSELSVSVEKFKIFTSDNFKNLLLEIDTEQLLGCYNLEKSFLQAVLDIKVQHGQIDTTMAKHIIYQRENTKLAQSGNDNYTSLLSIQKQFMKGEQASKLIQLDFSELMKQKSFTKAQLQLIKLIFSNVEEYMRDYIQDLNRQILSLTNELRFHEILADKDKLKKVNQVCKIFQEQDIPKTILQYRKTIDALRLEIIMMKSHQ